MSIAIGIDVGGTSTKGALVTDSGEVLERSEIPTETNAATKSVISVAESLAARAEQLGHDVAAAGIGAAGFIDHSEGCVTFSPNLVYDDPQLRTALGTRLGIPVTVDNDANAAAWGERAFGAAQGSDHVAVLTIGTGIGSGFIVEGRVVRGWTGAAAEFGHVVIDPDGPPCPCGLRGCLEQLASGGAIGRMGREAAEADPESVMIEIAGSVAGIEGEHVSVAANRMDETAMAILHRAGKALGVGMSNLVNVFDPEMIVLAGSAIQAGEPYLGAARDELVRMTAAQRRRPVRVDRSRLGNDAGIVGAAAMALDDLKS